MRNALKIAITLLAITTTLLVLILYNDYNGAERRNDLLKPYENVTKGVNVFVVENLSKDSGVIFMNTFKKNNYTIIGTYNPTFKIIKIQKNHIEEALPHETGHHIWKYKLTPPDRKNFCDWSDWEIWSYDGTCKEGFAEMYANNVIYTDYR